MKKILVILAIVILAPILAMVALYFTLDPFKELANNALAKLPGPVGEPFRSMPSDEELTRQMEEVSDYLLGMDSGRAVEKLLLVEASDKATYERLIKQMNRSDPNKTGKLMENMRKKKLDESPIMDTLASIKEEEGKEAKMQAEYLAGINLSNQVFEVKKILDEEKNAHAKLAKLFQDLGDDTVLEIFALLKEKDVDEILKKMDIQKALELKKKRKAKEESIDNIKNIASLFKPIRAKELAETLGPSSSYNKDELVGIYRELGAKKAGEVLSKVEDDEFVKDMLKKIKDREKLSKMDDSFSENLIESLNIYKKYDDKMDELVNVYMEMDEESTAKMIKTLYLSSGKPNIYTLKSGEKIVISDEDLALDLLGSFSYKKTASILSHFDNRIASDIFTKLALPEPQ